ncbi:MAG TPA: hypothetical protein VEM40_02445 [Nitrospirota bacterium]|nr:hypothetical protein [Nitrospirota bacterium]
MIGIVGFVLVNVKVNITRNYEGIFLLKGKDGAFLEVKDDLFLGEEDRYIAGIDLEREKRFLNSLFDAHADSTTNGPSLYYEWNKKWGEGFVRNYLPGGKQLLTAFSRFIDDGGKVVLGVFVGGGLPANIRDDDIVKMNETGMAYYDGVRWYHIWCNVNELIANSRNESIFPSEWKYLGSRVLHHNPEDLFLESSHEIMIDGVPLNMIRTAIFKAGEMYFVLTIKITNVGSRAATYYYLYGDEPWLGNYGTSGGNIGWSSDGVSQELFQYKGRINTKKLHYAGLWDYGNDVIGEGHEFTRTANFIEWFGNIRPDVFFSNGPYDFPQINEKRVPLSSNMRFLAVQWGPRTLKPGQSETYTLAIGMAGHDPKSGFPVKPKIDLKNFP